MLKKMLSAILAATLVFSVCITGASAITKRNKSNAKSYLISQVNSHKTKISFYGTFKEDATEFFRKAIISRTGESYTVLTSESTVGDFNYNMNIRNFTSQRNDYNGYYQYNYEITYRTSASEHKYIEKEIKRIAKKFTYKDQKYNVYAISDYVQKNMSYDSGKAKNQTLYPALKNKKGVCGHYANLFYRLAKASGLQCRVIVGNCGKLRHAWNMVKVNGSWYIVDCTVADSSGSGAYILMGQNSKYYKNYKPDVAFRNLPKAAKKSLKRPKVTSVRG